MKALTFIENITVS